MKIEQLQVRGLNRVSYFAHEKKCCLHRLYKNISVSGAFAKFQKATIIIEFLTSQLWLGNIHLSWHVVIYRIRLGGLICSLKRFLQLNMCQELQIFAVVYMYWGAS